MEIITTVKNSKIKEYLKLQKIAKFREKTNCFTIEGVRLIHEAFLQKATIEKIFITKECKKKIENSCYNFFKNYKLNFVSKEVANKIKSVKNSQEVFAIVRQCVPLTKEEITKNSFILALYEIKDPGNLGALIRTAFCFGFLKVIVFNCCDIYNDKVIRSSMGAVFGVKVLKTFNFEDILRMLKVRNIKTFASALSKNTMPSTYLKGKSGVLILGNEAKGLPVEIIEKADFKVRINMLDLAESLNVACAGSILMYEMKSNMLN